MGMTRILRRFRRNEKGATAVEFVILLPVMLVLFAAIIEGSRIYWNYQAVVTGVRDASRMIARTVNSDICDTGTAGQDVGGALALTIIRSTMQSVENGQAIFPSGVSLATGGTSAQLSCLSTPTLRTTTTPVVTVRTTVNIALPFGELFNFFGARNTATMTSTITDQSRIYGI